MANRQIKHDIKFFDPETFEQTCTYNGCADKFDIKTKEKQETHFPNAKQKRNIVYDIQYRQCSECGQTVKLDIDQRQTKKNKSMAITETMKG
ncbi:MAG: hypothetical protein ACOCUV_03290, partial [bacterium]